MLCEVLPGVCIGFGHVPRGWQRADVVIAPVVCCGQPLLLHTSIHLESGTMSVRYTLLYTVHYRLGARCFEKRFALNSAVKKDAKHIICDELWVLFPPGRNRLK